MKLRRRASVVIATLSVLLIVAIASTITLAAFSSQKTASTTITFADGLKMTLTPKGIGTFQIATAGENATEFIYNSNNTIANQTGSVTLDGITATLNKSGWVAYKIVLKETLSGVNENVAGAWGNDSGTITFTPTAGKTDWRAVLSVDPALYTVTVNANVVTVTGRAAWPDSSLTHDLFTSVVFRGAAIPELIDALAGRTFAIGITISANTESAPTFS